MSASLRRCSAISNGRTFVFVADLFILQPLGQLPGLSYIAWPTTIILTGALLRRLGTTIKEENDGGYPAACNTCASLDQKISAAPRSRRQQTHGSRGCPL